MYVVKRTESELWTVGYVGNNGKFEPESDHSSRQKAENAAIRLNGGTPEGEHDALKETVSQLLKRIDDLTKRVESLEEAEQERAEAEALGVSVELYRM